MNTTARAAYLSLLEIAGTGREFRVSEVLAKFDGDPDRIIGSGHDFEEKVQVIGQTKDEQTDGTVAVRVLRMQPGEILVRVRGGWRSSFGAHSTYMSCVLTPAAAERLDEFGERDAETADRMLQLLHLPRPSKDLADAWLMTIFGIAKHYQAKWIQEFPRMLDEALHDMVAQYHWRAVERLRADHPDMLGLLSPTYLDAGRLIPADLVGLCEWLQNKRPAASAA